MLSITVIAFLSQTESLMWVKAKESSLVEQMAELRDCNFGDRLHMVDTDVVSDKWFPGKPPSLCVLSRIIFG